MTKQEYLNHCKQRKSVRNYASNVLPSVTDPTLAQSGRDLLFNPKPIAFNRVDYVQGVPLEQMKSFDNMYAQKLDVFEDAKQQTQETTKKLDKLQETYKKSKNQPTPQNNQ